MDWTTLELKRLAAGVLDIASRLEREAGNDQRLALSQQEKDLVTPLDLGINQMVRDYLRASGIPAVVLTEEHEGRDVVGKGKPRFTIAIDDLDGSRNYSASDILPYCTIVSIYDTETPRYQDWRVAGIQMLNTPHTLLAVRGEGVTLDDAPLGRGRALSPRSTKELDRYRCWVSFDHYMGSMDEAGPFLEKLRPLYSQVWPSDIGSAGASFYLLATGGLDAHINPGQKETELVAGYPLCDSLGLSLTDFRGSPIGKDLIAFTGKWPILAAVTPELARVLQPYLE